MEKRLTSISQNIFLTRKESLKCCLCGTPVAKGTAFVAANEDSSGTCLACSPFVAYTFLVPGNVALTRRSKKHSTHCGVILEWNQRRKRYERKGQYVEAKAIALAQQECDADASLRVLKNQKAAAKRQIEDSAYIQAFAKAIRSNYPNCPSNREFEIAEHACEKYSRRVGRTADAKQFNINMIDLAVEAHIRHIETNYDKMFGRGKRKKEIRAEVKRPIKSIILSWK